VKQIVELKLTKDEKAMLDVSAEAVRKGIEEVAPFV
jgi:malate/lactate dehydrogenase